MEQDLFEFDMVLKNNRSKFTLGGGGGGGGGEETNQSFIVRVTPRCSCSCSCDLNSGLA